MSCMPLPPPPRKNCGWLSTLKNSARKSNPSCSRKRKCLIRDKSVFTKRGPDIGVRGALPSSPSGATIKAHGLNQAVIVFTCEGATHPGLAATGPGLFGSPTMLGRLRPLPFHEKPTPELLTLSTANSGKPEVAFSITSTSQPPRRVLAAPFQLAPKRLPLPKGRLYSTLAVNWWSRLICESPQSSFCVPGSGQ